MSAIPVYKDILELTRGQRIIPTTATEKVGDREIKIIGGPEDPGYHTLGRVFQIVRYERDGKQVVYKYLHPEWTILKSKTIPIGDDPNRYVQIIDGSGGHENLQGRIVQVIKYIDNNKTVVFRIPS